MPAFSSIDISETGLDMSRLWLEVISHNMANLDTVRSTDEEPFRAVLLEVAENPQNLGRGGGGVTPVALRRSDETSVLAMDPDHPLADERGLVQLPVVDLASEMSNLIIASRLYQVNLRAIESSREAYASALRIGAA